MLDDFQIEQNKQKFISLIRKIEREGARIDDLIHKLENSDFFTAPASTQYHCSYKGGLCEHSLHVYEQLSTLVAIEYPDRFVGDDDQPLTVPTPECPISEESIIITALLHDISKMNFYEVAERNTKDEKGNWVKVPFIKVKETKDRFILGNHELNSFYMTECFIPLNIGESAAIANHMGGKAYDSSQVDISDIYNKYPLALFLHLADMLATFKDERLI